MKTTQHTPGPWRLGMRAGVRHIYGDKGAEVCNPNAGFNTPEENLANARLIAAAPELLAALCNMPDSVYNYLESIGCDGNAIELQQAIRKAKGNQ